MEKNNVMQVQIGEETFPIKKLALGEYARLLSALQHIPTAALADLQNLDTKDSDGTIQKVCGVLAKAWSSFIEILAIGSGIEKDRLEQDPQIGLDGGIQLFLAIYEVNKIDQVVGTVKNALKQANT